MRSPAPTVSLSRHDFLQVLGAAVASGLGLSRWAEADAASAEDGLYDIPRFGQVSLLHMTDCHAQLRPLYYREPSVNLGAGALRGRLPHLAGDALLKASGMAPGTRAAHAFTSVDFTAAARRYGRVGGFAALATLVRRLKASRPGALLLDGGDSWQGSATALWTRAQDMVEASKQLGVDVMTGHWEFTYGMQRVQEIVAKDLAGAIEFVAQNVETADFGDPVFKPWVMREINQVPVAVIGQAFPYTPIAHPREFVADWRFGIQEERLQTHVDALRRRGAQVVVLLSHNGIDVDLKLAGRVSGIDAILGGHTHDALPIALPVANRGGRTLVTNAGSHGKFLGVLDFEITAGRVSDHRYRLLPVFAEALRADPAMDALIGTLRRPFEARLAEPLAVTDGLLYRRGNFNGSWDQLVCDALMEVQDAEIAFSPGFRWGACLLPGETITRERLMDMLAITYPETTITRMRGDAIHAVLEDVADNLFNPDPYHQQGGDMVRVGGLAYACEPRQTIGRRITALRLNGRPLDADRIYKVAGWAPVAQRAPADAAAAASRQGPEAASGRPVWDLVETWLEAQPGGHVVARRLNTPTLVGADGDPGVAPA